LKQFYDRKSKALRSSAPRSANLPIVGGTILFRLPRVGKNADKALGSSFRNAPLVELLQKQFELASDGTPEA